MNAPAVVRLGRLEPDSTMSWIWSSRSLKPQVWTAVSTNNSETNTRAKVRQLVCCSKQSAERADE